MSQEDPLEKEMATDSSILGQRSLVGYGPWGHRESVMTECLIHTHSYILFLDKYAYDFIKYLNKTLFHLL